MYFRDRIEAAEQLAGALQKFRGRHPLVLGIPRGGVIMARVIAERLEGEVDVVLVHKLGAPGQPEVALGAVDESGNVYVSPSMRGWVSERYLEEEKRRQLAELRRRRAVYTPDRPPVNPAGRTTMVVDDGLATGATMKAALLALRKKNPELLVVAVPVSSPEAHAEVSSLADEVVCLHVPHFFMAVGQFYHDFRQVSDEEVIAALHGERGT